MPYLENENKEKGKRLSQANRRRQVLHTRLLWKIDMGKGIKSYSRALRIIVNLKNENTTKI